MRQTSTSSGACLSALRFPNVDSLRSAFPSLDVRTAAADYFQQLAWFRDLMSHGIANAACCEFICAADTAAGECVALPLIHGQRNAAALWGRATTSLSNYYSSLYGPIADPDLVSSEAVGIIVAELRRSERPAVVDLQPLEDGGDFQSKLLVALSQAGYLTDTYFCFGNWYLRVEGRSFAEYEKQVPSKTRNNYTRGRKKLDSFGNWSLRVHTTTGDELEQAIADWDSIYRRSWKRPEPFPDFVPTLCRTAARRGWLRLGMIHLEGVAIAGQIWIVRNGVALIYKLAYDRAFKSLSAGSVLSSELFRRAIDEEKVVEIDYLTGDDRYKADWMSTRRVRTGVLAFDPRTPVGLASWLRHRAGKAWRGLSTLRSAPTPNGPPGPPGRFR